jgi:phosphoglycolate phosphatase-like HAD superfamily hydrolase
MPQRPLIALDADGVLLDFHLGYASAWERAFGQRPAERDPQAYWPIDRWHVTRLDEPGRVRFRAAFDEHFWSTVPAIDGAVAACHSLRDAGYDLVCVSALEREYEAARLRNLRQLGFPIERVIATGNASGDRSPKADIIERLRPVAFVDDYLPYLRGVPESVHTALVLRAPNGSPNTGAELALAKSMHDDLAAFADAWIARGHEAGPTRSA